MRLSKVSWTGWRLRLIALLVGLSLPLWKAYSTYGGSPAGFASPRLPEKSGRLWDIASFGVQHYDFPGQLPNGEAVILHIWIKALRSENSVLLRAVGAHLRVPCFLRTHLMRQHPFASQLNGLSAIQMCHCMIALAAPSIGRCPNASLPSAVSRGVEPSVAA